MKQKKTDPGTLGGRLRALFTASRHRLIILLCVSALFITAVTLLLLPEKRAASDETLVNYAVISDPVAGETLLYHKEEPLASLSGFLKKRSTSFGGKWDAVLTETGQLALMTGGKVECLREDVTDFLLSSEGGALVYLCSDGGLWSFAASDAQARLVTEQYGDSDLSLSALSPSGLSFCYPVLAEGQPARLCFFQEGETREVDVFSSGTLRVLALSDDSSDLYYLTADDTALYHVDGDGNSQKLTASFSRALSPARFNRTQTQVIFCERNGYTYFSEDGQEKEKLSSGDVTPVLFDGEACFSASKSALCETLSGEKLLERFYLVRRDEAQSLRYLDAELNSKKFASDVYDALLSSDERELYLVRYSDQRFRIYSMDLTSQSPTETLIASGVTDYAVDPSRRCVYSITRGNKLYRHGAEGSLLLAEGASEVDLMSDGSVFWQIPTEQEASVLYRRSGEETDCICSGVRSLSFAGKDAYVYIEGEGVERWYILSGKEVEALSHP